MLTQRAITSRYQIARDGADLAFHIKAFGWSDIQRGCLTDSHALTPHDTVSGLDSCSHSARRRGKDRGEASRAPKNENN